MYNHCIKLGINQCFTCDPSYNKINSQCIVDYYEKQIKELSDNDLKYFYLNIMRHYVDWEYFWINTLKSLFPQRFHIVERYILLK